MCLFRKFEEFSLMKQAWLKKELAFPQIFELGVWLIYVCLYKYSYYLGYLVFAEGQQPVMPYPELILYALLTTAYLIPYYRGIIPYLISRKRYALLLLVTLLYLAFVSKLSNLLVNFLFLSISGSEGMVGQFYSQQLRISIQQASYVLAGWNLDILVTDLIAFSCIAFVRYAFESERRRYQLEKENLQLQFDVLKTQLQPHFLFNTLNSIYSLSLSGSKETPRFIMLLSDMMRHILYNSSKERIALKEEITFLEHYVEMEQKKYPQAVIELEVTADEHAMNLQVPPLLLLPLVENSFKHGAHRLTDNAYVRARLIAEAGNICFSIENSVYKNPLLPQQKVGGIGLVNIRQRLHLYYPHEHAFTITENESMYKTELRLKAV